MNAYRLKLPRGAGPWSPVRPLSTRSYSLGSHNLSQTISPRHALSGSAARDLPSPAGRRMMSSTQCLMDSELRGPRRWTKEETIAEHVMVQPENHRPLLFGRFWLRENCPCSTCVNPDTKQRMGDTFSIDKDVTETEVVHNDKGVEIEWSDGHQSVYSWDWLLPHENRFQRTVNLQRFMERAQRARKFRVVDPIMDPSPTVSYDQVMSENASLLDWLDKIHTFGFCFVEGVPVTPEATKTLIERIAFIRHTHYGGFWDFTADLTYKDTAYTNEFLGPHTDNTYFTDPARLQLFHLLSHTDGEGGENLLVDGFAAADVLLNENPKHHAALMAHKHPWHASGNEDVCIQPVLQAPVIQSHPTYRRVYQIRWNNYDRAPKIDWHIAEQKLWYAAASQFNKIINQPLMQIWTPLKPGTALIFDNWRMLHGRSEFTGKRRMCGGYINNDDYLSRHRLLKFGREKVLNNLGNFWINKDNPNSIY